MDNSSQINKCDWCRNKTELPISYHAMSPIQPKMEEKMISENKNVKMWYEREKEIDPKLFDQFCFYDQLTCTVGKGVVCAKCLDKDYINWKKYRKNEKANTK